MANKSQDFRSHHIAHIASALKAATDAGIRNPSVHVRLPSGAELRVGAGDRSVAPAVRKPAAPAVVRPTAPAVRRPVAAAPLKPPRGIRPSR